MNNLLNITSHVVSKIPAHTIIKAVKWVSKSIVNEHNNYSDNMVFFLIGLIFGFLIGK